ncbi:MAG TPA: NlpC/P60 family protein [Acidimicrobiales bacterium]|nr:NlpC/P60 family protein [Acidimicrobiales bacterium]
MKHLAAAAAAACLAVGAGPLAVVLAPVLALAGGGALAPDVCGIPGDVNVALATIRQLESGNNYTSTITSASASGAYAFLDSAWRAWSAKAGYPDLHPRAYLAPPHVQDAAPDSTEAVPGSCATGDVAPVLAFARAQLGKPYVFATAGPDTYDCSGLTLAAYATIGIQLPHASALQARLGVAVPHDPAALRPGDLLFYFSPSDGDLGHVAIAISNVEEIQAPRTGDVVKITPTPYARIQPIRRFAASANPHEAGP